MIFTVGCHPKTSGHRGPSYEADPTRMTNTLADGQARSYLAYQECCLRRQDKYLDDFLYWETIELFTKWPRPSITFRLHQPANSAHPVIARVTVAT
jgi:hypothetical protein